MGIATVITSGKGGVGKSTLSVGIGRALAEKGRRVLLVDCDTGLRSLDRMTGVEEALVFDVYDVVHARCAPIEAIYACKDSERLFLLPAPSQSDQIIAPEVMGRLITLLKEYYDNVIIDSPAGVGTGFRSAACAADAAVIVCSPDAVCVRSMNVVNRLLQEMKVPVNGFVINRFNADFFDNIDTYDDLDAVIDSAGLPLLGVVPEDFEYAAAFLKGVCAKALTPGMMAVARIAGRLEGERIPLQLRV